MPQDILVKEEFREVKSDNISNDNNDFIVDNSTYRNVNNEVGTINSGNVVQSNKQVLNNIPNYNNQSNIVYSQNIPNIYGGQNIPRPVNINNINNS